MRTDTQTRLTYQSTNDKGELSIGFASSEDVFNKRIKEAKEAGQPDPTIVKSQTFKFSEAETVDEALALAGGDEKVMLISFNYGARLFQQNESRDLLLSDEFAPQDGELDLAYAVAQASSGRTKMSKEDKAAKALGVTAEQLRAALALITQQAGTAA